MKKLRNYTIAIFSVLLIILVVILTLKAIYIEPHPQLFDIDFKNKSDLIQGYSSLIGSILTFLSIIFVIYTIIQQGELFEKDKKIEQENELNNLKDRIFLINNLVSDLIKHVLNTGEEIKIFYENELKEPLASNSLKFYVNNNFSRILEMDSLNIFKAFQIYYSKENRITNFNKLFKLVDFYSESHKELKAKFDYHINDKLIKKTDVVNSINSVMNKATQIIEKYRKDYPENYETKVWHNLLNGLIAFYYERIPTDDEADLELIDKEVLLLFLKEANFARQDVGFEYETQKLVIQISGIRKKLFSLKQNSLAFAKHLKERHEFYYSGQGEYFQKLKTLEENLSKYTSA